MIKNYLRIALRNLFKHKGYSFINIAGLAIGMTCCLLIAMYVLDELSYDRFHEKSDRIYRLVADIFPPNDGPVDHYATSGPGVGKTLQRDLPEVEKSVYLWRNTSVFMERDQDVFHETVHFADSTFFEVFSYHFISGNPETALQAPFSIVLTEDMASKYFNSENPVGQTIVANDSIQYQITGIIANVPSNSHLHFDFLASLSTMPKLGHRWLETWWSFGGYNYLLLAESTDVVALGKKLHRISAEYIPEQETGSGYRQEYYLQPITDIHLRSERRNEWQPNNKMAYVYIFSVISVFILLIACINFMNLATARSLDRSKEVGIRKVVGAIRTQLTRQFLSESIVLSIISTILALLLVNLLLPSFNELTGKELSFSLISQPQHIFVLLAFTLGVGFMAGSYPALFLSAFKPVETIKGKLRASSKGAFLRKGLVVFQFAISVVLIIGTTIVFKQLTFMRGQDLGYNQEQIVIVPLHGEASLREKYDPLKNMLKENSGVVQTTISSGIPGRLRNNSVFRIEGNMTESPYGSDAWNDMRYVNTDEDFFEIYGIELLAGRFFSKEFETDQQSAFILNEAAVKKFEWGTPETALGKKIGFRSSSEGQVVGVVKNFHFESLHSDIAPVVMTHRPFGLNYISIKVSPTKIRDLVAHIENTWNALIPNRPFEFYFLDQDFDRQYRADERVGRTFGTFSALAIFIACLGLFGLAAYSAEQRTKEIGIRKVLGASVTSIIRVLSLDFLKLVLIANLAAWPIAYFAMAKWLEDFAFRTSINMGIFPLAGVVALFIAFLTVGFQAVKAALNNPVETLRYE
ncbi:ABC transporter permease [bacterium]|nr:ABC transporter permease [bacterium]